jgi:hypothetical protein
MRLRTLERPPSLRDNDDLPEIAMRAPGGETARFARDYRGNVSESLSDRRKYPQMLKFLLRTGKAWTC